MLAKRFFYVCAGLLCLALAYQLGVGKAQGQGGGTLSSGDFFYRGLYALTPDGRIYSRGTDFPSNPWTLGRTVPVTSRAVALRVESGAVFPNPFFYVFTEDGTVFECDGYYGACSSTNAFTGPTPATPETWGSVKARYRQPASAAPQDR